MQEVIEGFRLSPQQNRVWLLPQDNAHAVYCAQCAVLVEGDLKPAILKEALRVTIGRHEILRTVFRSLPGSDLPVQVITEDQGESVSDYDLTGEDAAMQETIVAALFEETRRKPFDLEHGPLLQVSFIRFSPDRHLLLMRMPALCTDAVGLRILIDEISRSYAALLHGVTLSDEPMQYADVAEWQNKLLEDQDTELGRTFWSNQKIPSHSSLKLPFENQFAAKDGFEPRLITARVAPEVMAGIDIVARKYGVKDSVYLLACWQVLLFLLNRRSDIVVGAACDIRKYEELKDTPGLFTRYLPLYSVLDDSARFCDILAQTAKTLGDINKWQEYFGWNLILPSFEDATEGPTEPPFHSFCFDFEDWSPIQSAGLSFSISMQYACIDRFKIRLLAARQSEFLVTEFHYDANAFSKDVIERLAEHYHTLLASTLQNPDSIITKLNILTPHERQQLLVDFNETRTEYPSQSCVHQLFEAQVEQTPANIAVVCGDESLTYSELNKRANRLAHYLRGLGVGPDRLVGICMERCTAMLVGILGVLKSGGAYVPLDPAHPRERLALMLEGVEVLLTKERSVDESLEYAGEVVCLDTDWGLISRESEEDASTGATPANLAYVIYTSGSTGRPKGVMVPHQGLVNYLSWCTKAYRLEEGRGTLVQSSVSFDLTVTSLFSPLLSGRTVVLLPEDTAGEALGDELRTEGNYSLIKITPSQLELLSERLSAEEAPGRTRAFIIGGEALRAETLSFWQTHARDTRLINEYGPTETVVGCSIYEVPPGSLLTGTVPIGVPIANTEIYLLDAHLEPVPRGTAGELYIGGDGLARGYLNRPDLTAERFIPHPFSSRPGARLYHSGDVARHQADGQLEYLGRSDQQVKLRGYRIELGEIEAVVGGFEGVREAVAVVRAEGGAEPETTQRLICYVVWAAGMEREGGTSRLRSYVREQLPEYMMPAVFVAIERMPLTSSGKIDRQSLPLPESLRPEGSQSFVAPREGLELQLAQIWEKVLNVWPVGIMDNFFDLGGNSFLAVRLMALIEKRFEQRLPLSTLFQKGTIEQLASLIRRNVGIVTASPLVGIQPNGSHRPFFCIHPGGGNVFSYLALAYHLGHDYPFYGLQAQGLTDGLEPHAKIEDMAAHYIEAMRGAQPEGPYLLGGHSFGGFVAFEMAQQLLEQGQEISLLAILDTTAPIRGNIAPAMELNDAGWMIMIAKVIEHFSGQRLSVSHDELQRLQPKEQLDYFLDRLRMINFLPAEAGVETIIGLLKVYKANDRAVRRYSPRVYSGRITLFRSSERLPEDFGEGEHSRDDPILRWRELTPEPVEVIDVPGDHITMLTEPFVQTLAQALRSRIDDAQGIESAVCKVASSHAGAEHHYNPSFA